MISSWTTDDNILYIYDYDMFFRVYFISSDLLKGKSLDEVGLLAYTENKEALMLNALVGNVQVLSSSDASLRPVSVSDVTCDDLTSNNLSTTSHLMTDEDKTGKSLSLRLQWCQPDIDADITSYHIWLVIITTNAISSSTYLAVIQCYYFCKCFCNCYQW